jgi:type I restriction enzyme, S subunit
MTVETFFANFGHLADAPNGVKKLRELILQLAVQGKLVPQVLSDEPASFLLKKIEEEKRQLHETAKIKLPKKILPVAEDEKPTNLPQPWQWVRLEEVFYPVSTGNKKVNTRDILDNGEFPVVDQGKSYVSGYINDKSKVIHIPGPVIVFGDHTRAVKYVDFDFVGGADGIKVLRPIGIYERYFFKVLEGYDLEGRGYGRHYKILLSKLFPLPPLEEQKHIVAKVDQLMTLCDELEARQQKQLQGRVRLNNSALDALLTAREPDEFADHWQRISTNFDLLYDHPETIAKLRAAILQLAVQGKLVPQYPSDEPALILLEKIAAGNAILPSSENDEEVFKIPSGWAWSKLGDLVQPNRGITYGVIKLGPEPRDGGVTTLRCSDVLFRTISGIKARKISSELSLQYERTILEGGELLMNIRGTLGGCGVVTEEFVGCNIAREVAMIPIHRELNTRYILNVISSPYIQETTFSNLRGIAYKGLNLSLLRGFQIPLPPIQEQKRIVAKVDQLMVLCDELEVKLNRTQQQSEKLMEATVRKLLVA